MILPRKGLPSDIQIERSTFESTTLVLHSAAISLPHPRKTATGGEDAFFLGTDDLHYESGEPVNVTYVGGMYGF